MTAGQHDSQFEHIPYPNKQSRGFDLSEGWADEARNIFDVNAYVTEKMKAFTSAVDVELEKRIIEHLRSKGWTVDKRQPMGAEGGDDFWWALRGAIMTEMGGIELDYEVRSSIAEDAARDVKKAIAEELELRELTRRSL